MARFSSASKKLLELENFYNEKPLLFSDAQLEEKNRCESSFYEFVKSAWPIIEGMSPFLPGWHAEAICEHLEALYRLDINRLIINIPPRLGKSNICSVLYCAWIWTKEPHLRFLYSSYAQSLSVRDSVKCRRLVQSGWYQSLWGHQFKLMGDVNNKLRFDNNKTGYRIASSVGGSNTGEGAHFEVADDPNNVLDVSSEVTREGINNWHDFVMSSRHSGVVSQFRRLVVQQRTHEGDVTGNILSKKDSRWIHLCLPMEYEADRACKTIILPSTKGKIWEDPRMQEGQLLWPEGVNQYALDLLKSKDFRNDSYRISGQLQQRPAPASGGIIKKEWFQWWCEDTPPNCKHITQSWDSAYSGLDKSKVSNDKTTCYSACTTWGVFDDENDVPQLILLNSWQGKVEFPELRRKALELSKRGFDPQGKRPDVILIEAKASGLSLLQDLRRLGVMATQFNPNPYGDKEMRVRRITHLIEAGRVWVPAQGPDFTTLRGMAAEFVDTCAMFPKGGHNDLVDSMSQALIRIYNSGWIYHPEDNRQEIAYDTKNIENALY